MRPAVLLSFVFLFSVPCSSAPAADSIRSSDRFAIQTWTTEDGLPQNITTAVLQTRAGYIWAATYNGLARFDGVRFTVFDSSNTRGLPNSRITALFEDAHGDMWIGHDTGDITLYSGGSFRAVSFRGNWTGGMIAGIGEDSAGDIWVLNLRGEALRMKDSKILRPPADMAEEPTVVPQMVADLEKRLLVARNGVIAEITPAGYRHLQFPTDAIRPYYARLAPARAGGWWISGDGRVRRWANDQWKEDLGPYPWGEGFLVDMMESSSGQLFVGTLDRGLFVYDRTAGWQNFDRSSGFSHDWIRCITEDNERNVWLGTGGGLMVLRPRKVMMRSPPDLWQGRAVHGICMSKDTSLWAATEGAGVYRYQEGAWTQLGISAGLSNLFVWTVMNDSAGNIWAGTWGGGLFRWQQDHFAREFDLAERGEPVTALLESPAGTLWIGTTAGLLHEKDGRLTRLAVLGGPAAGDVRALAPCSKGGLWVGTQGKGLGLVRDGELKAFRAAEGLPRDFILSLYDDPEDGTLWIGTLDRGLCRFRDGHFTTISTDQGLPANGIGHIEDDTRGHLWCSSQKGLFRLGKHELNSCADGIAARVNPLLFGKAEGLASLACSSGFTPSGFRTPDGRLWFPTAQGIAVVEPKAVTRNNVPPVSRIEDVLVDGQPASIETPADASKVSHITLRPGQHQLDIGFTGISLTSPDRVVFQYRLEGIDADWSGASSRRRVTYPFLPPGQYTFRVQACNSDGLWSAAGDALQIIVLPDPWQTWWFESAAVLAGFGLVGAGVYFGVRRRHAMKLERIARERELERERSRIAQDIHDDLGASLTRIGMLSQSAAGDMHEPERAAAELNDIYTTACDLTRAMDEIVWAVNPRHDTLESLVNYLTRFAHDFLSAAHIRCRIEAAVKLPELSIHSEIRHNLFLAFKEVLNNAVKHSGATEVHIALSLPPGQLRLAVTDNGVGLQEGKSATMAGRRVVSGYGMKGIQQRLEQIGGHTEVGSGPVQGTRVDLVVPLLGVREKNRTRPDK